MLQQWCFVASQLDQIGNLVLDIQGASLEPGASLIVWPRNGNANQLWSLNGTGQLVSKLNGFVLDVSGGNTGSGARVISWLPRGTKNQLWTVNADGSITDQLNSFALDISGGSSSAGSAVVVNPRDTSLQSQQWVLVPDYSFADILAMPQDGFPPFEGDRLTAYQSISQQVVSGSGADNQGGIAQDIRQAYPLTDVTIPHSVDSSYTKPAEVAQADWDFVVKQLNQEFLAVNNTRALFSSLGDYYDKAFFKDSLELSRLISASELQTSNSINGSIVSIFSGLMATVVGTLGPEAAVLASMLAAGIQGAALSNAGSGNFQAAQSDLWDTLGDGFTQVNTALGNQQTQILSNWGPLQKVQNRILSDGPDSLQWSDSLTAKLLTASGPGTTVALLQMLMPARFQIAVYPQTTDSTKGSDYPEEARWVEELSDGFYNVYVLRDPTGNYQPGGGFLQKNLWDNGVLPQNFFKATNGWEGFQYVYLLEADNPCNSLVTIVTNQTSRTLTVDPADFIGNGSTELSRKRQTLPPAGSVMFITNYAFLNGNGLTIAIIDPVISSTNAVASFTTHQHDCVAEGADVWVDGISSNNGYSVGQWTATPGTFAVFPGAVVVPIQNQS